MRNCCALFIALVAAAALATPTGCLAQLYVSNDDNGRVISYVDTSGTILNPTETFEDIRGMAIEEDGTILVAESCSIKRLDPVAGSITTVDPYGYAIVDVYPAADTTDIFTITRGVHPALNVMLGGVGPAEWGYGFTDMTPVDLQVYPTGERAGNVIILVGGCESASLVELVRTGLLTFVQSDPVAESLGGDPAGFAITPEGGFIYLDHAAGMFEIDSEGEAIPFGPPGQMGWDHITISSDGTVYVSDSVMNRIHRFDSSGDWILPSLRNHMGTPGALVAAGFTPLHEGSNVTIEPIQGLEVMFEEIAEGGYSMAIPTTMIGRTSPGGNVLPMYADSPVGRSGFTYVQLETEAVYEDLIQVEAFWLGERMFFVHGAGDTFRDMTVVGSIEDARGVIPRFESQPMIAPPGPREMLVSEVVLVDDSRTVEEVAAYKFYWLLEALANNGQSPSQQYDLVYAKRDLERRVHRARTLYDAGLFLAANAELGLVASDIRNLAGKAIPNSSADPEGNVTGDLLARTKTLMFSIGLLVGPSEGRETSSAGSVLSLSIANPAYGECRMALSGRPGVRTVARIYSAAGKLVRTVFEGDLSDGTTDVVWDGLDRRNMGVASGVYFAIIEAGSERVIRKLAYIR